MTITDKPGTDLVVWSPPAEPAPRAHSLLVFIGLLGFLAVVVAVAYVVVTGGR